MSEMILLDGGTFTMGSASGRDDEAPPHEVEVSRFYIARCSVTNREYGLYLARAGAPPPPLWNDPAFSHADQPVVAVSWDDAVAYCAWLTAELGETYRLPTEAEREFACRGGTVTAYPWGETAERDLGAYGTRWFEGSPGVVGGPPNGFDLCNMADNVHEWCADWYGRDYYSLSPRKDPPGPASGVRRVSRGGSWRHHVKVTRSSARSAIDPRFRYTDYGFRVVCSVPPQLRESALP